MIRQQQERMNRLYGLRQVTRLQKAQIDAEMAKAEVRVEQSLSEYVASSQALTLLIGDSSVVGGAAIYLPVDYADDLAQAVPVNFEDALATAQATRPDFKINDINALMRQIAEAQARVNTRPDLRLAQLRLPARLAEAGVPFCFGGRADQVRISAVLAVRFGLDRKLALQALTRTPAVLMDQADKVGSLRQGTAADFTVWTGDPLDLDSALLATWVDGVRVHGDAPKPTPPPTAPAAGASIPAAVGER